MQHRVAIDVGSGYTNVKTDGKDDLIFASRVCVAPPRWKQQFGSTEARVCRVGNKEWLIGHAVRAMGGTPENTLSHTWSQSDGWMVLLYSALAELEIEGDVYLATGLPQAVYEDQRDILRDRLLGPHSFTINNREYHVHIRDAFIIPQATAALLYQMGMNQHMTGDVGCIDVGTFTTGLAVIDLDSGSLIVQRSNGMAIGVATLLSALETHLANRYALHLDGPRLLLALQHQQVKVRGETIDLSGSIYEIAMQEAKPMLEFIQEMWNGGADLDVFLAGGGADYFARAIRSVVPHAQVIPDPQKAVARGLYNYLEKYLDSLASS